MPAGPPEDPSGAQPLASSQGRYLAIIAYTMRCPGGLELWSRWGQVATLLLLLGVPLQNLALPPIRYSHAGICPNDMNPNLWVDAQSTCKRECETDQVSRLKKPELDRLNVTASWKRGGLGQVEVEKAGQKAGAISEFHSVGISVLAYASCG